MNRIFTLIAIICVMVGVDARAAVIKGVVTDVEGQPMAFTTVWVEDINRTTVSGLDGSYTLRNVPEGKHQVFATYIGHKKEIATVNVASGMVTCNFVLDESTEVLPELFVIEHTVLDNVIRIVIIHNYCLKPFTVS